MKPQIKALKDAIASLEGYKARGLASHGEFVISGCLAVIAAELAELNVHMEQLLNGSSAPEPLAKTIAAAKKSSSK
jgi:hypothetical protein